MQVAPGNNLGHWAAEEGVQEVPDDEDDDACDMQVVWTGRVQHHLTQGGGDILLVGVPVTLLEAWRELADEAAEKLQNRRRGRRAGASALLSLSRDFDALAAAAREGAPAVYDA